MELLNLVNRLSYLALISFEQHITLSLCPYIYLSIGLEKRLAYPCIQVITLSLCFDILFTILADSPNDIL